MDIKDILTLANAGYTAEQINAMNAQQTVQQVAPQMQIPAQQTVQQVAPQMQIPAQQTVQQIPFPMAYPQNMIMTPAPMPPAPTVPAAQPEQVAQQTPSETGTTQTTPLVPGNPTAEQLAGQLAQAQASNLNGVTIATTPKVSIEDRLAEHYTSLMGGKTKKEGGK